MSNTDRTDPPTPDELPPGPYSVEWPDEQGGLFTVWGRQGTPPDFADGWAIPLVAKGMQSVMEWLADHLNRGASWSTSTPIATATGSAAGGASSPEAKTTTDAALPSAPDQRLRDALANLDERIAALMAYKREHATSGGIGTRIIAVADAHATVQAAALSEATTSPEATLDAALAALRAAAEVLPGLDDRYDARYRSGYERFRHDIVEIAARLRGPA